MSEPSMVQENDVSEPPLDRQLDRRQFLARFAALTTVTSAATLARPLGARASTASSANLAPLAGVKAEAKVPSDLTEVTLAQAATLIRAKKIAAIDLVDAYLARIDAYESIYQAFNTVLADEARAIARSLDLRGEKPPLFGVPVAVKDNYYTAGVRTTANSYIFENFVPSFDATGVARLKAAGAIIIGKTQMGPLATTRATTPDGVVTTVNAWTPNTPSVNPGGSSTGSATAVAGRMAASSVGTQTGGSITGPSTAQGLTGLKPTMGRTSIYGIIPLSYTRDHSGPLARDAMDAAIMTQVLAGPDENDPRTLGLPKVPNLITAATPVRKKGKTVLRWPTTIGVLPGYTSGTSATANARRAMLDTFADLGAEIVDVPLPDDWSVLTGGAFNNVRLPERSEPFLEYLKQDVRLFGVSLSGWINGLFISGDEFLKGQRAKCLLARRVFEQIFSVCDVVVQTDPVPFDIIGFPEIAFPIGFQFNTAAQSDIPIGAILGGMPYAEDRLLSLVAAYQDVTDFHLRRPPDPVVASPLLARTARTRKLRLTMEEVEATSE
ncbi:MAG TPA: amidase [Candidatus Binatia bacterium]